VGIPADPITGEMGIPVGGIDNKSTVIDDKKNEFTDINIVHLLVSVGAVISN
jgi:hypothetical protein